MMDVVRLKQFKQDWKDYIQKLKDAEYGEEEARMMYMSTIMANNLSMFSGILLHWFEKWWKKQ